MFFDHDKGKTHSSRQAALLARASSRTAARGSTSSSTPRTSSTSASTAAGSCTRRCCCARSATRPRSCSTTSTTPRRSSSRRARSTRKSVEYDLLAGQRATRDISHPETQRSPRQEEPQVHQARDQEAEGVERRPAARRARRARRQGRARTTSSTRRPARSSSSATRSSPRPSSTSCASAASSAFKILFIDGLNVGPTSATRCSPTSCKTPEEAILEIYRRLRPGDPPTLETAQNLFNNLFFNPERYDLSKVGRLKLNYKFKHRRGARQRRSSPSADILETVRYLIELKNGRGVDRRHRPPRQPPRARGRRADGEPVPHRSGPHGARHQGAHEHVSGDRDAHAARPDQRQAGLGGGQGVLRLLAALAVHGPDQPALRGHAQAPPLGARARRSHPRARGLRGARRSRHPLRPHLPDRDAGRSEHRPHRVAVDLRPRQRVRLHRDAVPQGRGRQGRRRGRVLLGARRRRGTTSPRRTPRSTRRASSPRTTSSCRHNGDVPDRQARGGDADGRVAEPAGVGRRLADPVPRARRRQPRAHGLEHAAPGGAAHPHHVAARSAPAWRASSPATRASPSSPSATASSSRSTPPASSSAPPPRATIRCRPSPTSTT